MKRLIGILAAIGAGTLLALSAGPVLGAPVDDPMVMQARQIMDRFAERGTWRNPMLSESKPLDALSADTVMAFMLARYTQAQLDRGGWLNPYVTTGRYDAGHPLLAAALGDGAETGRHAR